MTDTTTPAPEAGETTAPVNIQPSSGGLAGDEQGFIDWDTLEADEPSPGDEELGNEDHLILKDEPEPAPVVEEEKKRPSGAQRAKAQRDSLLSQIAERDRKIAELLEKRTKEGVTPPEPSFDGDLYGFEQKVSAEQRQKEAREVVQSILNERDQKEARERELKEAHDAMEAHIERVEEAKKTIADYDKVMESMKNVEVRNELIQEITRSDQSGLIAYHLAKHPDELAALDDMTPQEMAKTIGRLEVRLEKALAAKKATTAPRPLSQPKGGVAPKDQTAEVNAWLDRTYGNNRRR